MNFAIILSGGTGIRLGYNVPKQYLEVGGREIIRYSLSRFQENGCTDGIIIVASSEWWDSIKKWIKEDNITKFTAFAKAGSSRQHSIMNGLTAIDNIIEQHAPNEQTNVLIHDAARPNVSSDLISRCFEGLHEAEGVMPVLPVKDTMYLSKDGMTVTSLLNRDELFAGQAPESFLFQRYYDLHKGLTEQDLSAVRGSSEIAYKNGMTIKMIPGDEHNYKITTEADLEKFRTEMGE